jgi:hypothetical protein
LRYTSPLWPQSPRQKKRLSSPLNRNSNDTSIAILSLLPRSFWAFVVKLETIENGRIRGDARGCMVGVDIALGVLFNVVLVPSRSHRREVRPIGNNYVHVS